MCCADDRVSKFGARVRFSHCPFTCLQVSLLSSSMMMAAFPEYGACAMPMLTSVDFDCGLQALAWCTMTTTVVSGLDYGTQAMRGTWFKKV